MLKRPAFFSHHSGRFSGSGNGMYWAAINFFADRDKAKKQEAKKAKKTPAAASATSASGKMSKAEVEAFAARVQAVPLDDLRVFDDCDEVRSKIGALIARGFLQSHLLRTLQVNSNSFGRFMSLKGKDAGNDNALVLCNALSMSFVFIQGCVGGGELKLSSR